MLRDCHTHNLASTDGIISVNPDFNDFKPNKNYSCGIHPWTTHQIENETTLFDQLEKTCSEKKIIALGEAGIDRMRGLPLTAQINIFIKQIELSEKYGLPIILHCVKASSELLQLKKKFNPRQPWIFHCFRGGFINARQLTDAGLYLSIGEKFNRDGIKGIPHNKLLVETDESQLSIEEIAARIGPDALKISTYNLNNLLNN